MGKVDYRPLSEHPVSMVLHPTGSQEQVSADLLVR